jgi:spore coat protein U-like protein
MTLRIRALSVAALAMVLGTSAASAATTGDAFLVSITLTNVCSVVANDLPFGTQTSLTAIIDVTTSVDVTCSGANPVSVAFDAGDGTGSTIANRLMSSGANTVAYNIYRDSGHATVLGQTAGTNTIDFTSTGAGSTDSKPVYGRVPIQASKPNGTYQSNVTVTLTY